METGCEAPRIVAGMPMYNEEETIGTVVTMALRHVDEVICIDDGSSDSSARIAEACGATVIRHRGNQGYGAALKTLFKTTRDSDTDVLVVLDSDGQHDTKDIPKLIQPILDEEADFTIGSRFVEGGEGNDMPAYRRLGIKVITAASNLTSDLDIKDTQSGFRAFSRKAIDRLRFDADGMELSLEMLEDAKEKQLTIQEVPTVIRYDVPKGSNFTAISVHSSPFHTHVRSVVSMLLCSTCSTCNFSASHFFNSTTFFHHGSLHYHATAHFSYSC